MKTDVALLPVGSTECHGPHLPTSTDWLVAEELARRIKEKIAKKRIKIEVLPTIKLAPTYAAASSKGTVNISPEKFQKNVFAAVKRFKSQKGLKKLFIISGHWGRTVKACFVLVALRIREELDAEVYVLDYPSARHGDLPKNDMHAGEIETSIMLASHPKLVGNYKVLKPRYPLRRPKLPKEVYAAFTKKDFRTLQWHGEPAAARTETGKKILDEVTSRLASVIEKCL